uniref:Uncharacterized protein n=1 Tax=Arundo donax TaxID=35708 RepID=A0A0A9FRY7_ARUDO
MKTYKISREVQHVRSQQIVSSKENLLPTNNKMSLEICILDQQFLGKATGRIKR